MQFIGKLELFFSDIIASAVPWLAPVPTAYSVFRAGFEGLGWPVWVAFLGALAIEGLGVSAANTAMTLYSYEQNRRKSDASASNQFAVAILASFLYLAAALILIALVEVEGLTGTSRFVPIVFPFLGLAAMIILALRSDHRRRVLGIEDSRKSKQSNRTPKKSRNSDSESDVGKPTITIGRFLSMQESERPTAKQLISDYGIAKSTAYDWHKKAKSS